MRLALVAATIGSVFPARVALAAGGRPIAPPAGPMLYSRTLVRSLAGGATLSVSRDFEIRFLPTVAGFRVEGRQVAASVEAPEAIAALARMEEQRIEDGVFPLELDQLGKIMSEGKETDAAVFDRAAATAKEQIDAQGLPADERRVLIKFVETVHRAASSVTSELPTMLFAPDEGRITDTRTIALPGGGAGEMASVFEAHVDPVTGLMRSASRQVVTKLDGTSRTTTENWALAAL